MVDLESERILSFIGENDSLQDIDYSAIDGLKIKLSWYGLSDVGLRREVNEDSFIVKPPLFSVADGMGGHEGGDRASKAVVENLNKIPDDEPITRSSINEALQNAVNQISNEIENKELGAGTTVTGITFGRYKKAPTWDVFNIGDSRVYQYYNDSLTQVTTDHSVVQHLIESGAITEEEAEIHPHANVITRAVGFNEEPVPDYYRLAIVPGQRILICSDGLTKELTDVGIQNFLATMPTAEEAARELVNQALGNSGRDNITVVVIDVHAVDGKEFIDAETETPAAHLDIIDDEVGDTQEIATADDLSITAELFESEDSKTK